MWRYLPEYIGRRRISANRTIVHRQTETSDDRIAQSRIVLGRSDIELHRPTLTGLCMLDVDLNALETLRSWPFTASKSQTTMPDQPACDALTGITVLDLTGVWSGSPHAPATFSI